MMHIYTYVCTYMEIYLQVVKLQVTYTLLRG